MIYTIVTKMPKSDVREIRDVKVSNIFAVRVEKTIYKLIKISENQFHWGAISGIDEHGCECVMGGSTWIHKTKYEALKQMVEWIEECSLPHSEVKEFYDRNDFFNWCIKETM